MTDHQFAAIYKRLESDLKGKRLSPAQVSELVMLVRMRGEGR